MRENILFGEAMDTERSGYRMRSAVGCDVLMVDDERIVLGG